MLTILQPRQPAGQEYIRCTYDAIETLKERGNKISIRWLPSDDENELLHRAKEEARRMTKEGSVPQAQFPATRSTTLNLAKSSLPANNTLPEKVGKFSKRIDKALPGKHTKKLYDSLTRREASVLAQMRTGMARLNTYLHRIRAAASVQYACRCAPETIEHFLFTCIRWTAQRMILLQAINTYMGNLSYFLRGKAVTDGEDWTPDLRAVKAAIKFAITTGRLEAN
jgi:hypothetical protein